MIEFKGTKGKWILKYPKDSNGYMYINDNIDGNGNIATCYTVDYSGWDNNITDETKANAQLISKAQEMLEMLKGILSDIHSGNYPNGDWKVDEIEQLIKEATI